LNIFANPCGVRPVSLSSGGGPKHLPTLIARFG